MFTEELKLIKEAEEQADEMRREARISAKNFVEETDCDALLKEGREKAQKLYEEAIKQAEDLCAAMTVQAGEKQEEAVKFIAERIVG